MVHFKVPASFGLLAMSLLAILALGVSGAPTQTSTALQVRAPGHVAEYFDQAELIKRVNILLFTTIIESFAKVTNTACVADIEPTTKAAICAIAVIGTIAVLTYGAYKAFQARAEMDMRAPMNMINLIPQIEGQSNTKTLLDQYTGLPILMGYNDCYGPGCFEVHYQNHYTAQGRMLHHVTVRPRNNGTSSLTRRQDEQESGNDSNMDLYGDYLYHDEDKGVEGLVPGSESQTDFEDGLEHDVDKDEFTNTGVHCFNIYDSDSGDLTSAGYLSLNNDTPYQDPDNEDSYISQCEGMGTG